MVAILHVNVYFECFYNFVFFLEVCFVLLSDVIT